MLIDTARLPKDERTYLELREIYEAAGYALYRMRRFEEYSLYLDNRNFLGSGQVLTFQGYGGKLMALKPDVTLSIAKNARFDDDKPVKVYYRESVYRTAGESGDFREINQMGLEYMGRGDGETVEICDLAMRSLAAIDPAFVFAVSHMGALSALIESAGVTAPSRATGRSEVPAQITATRPFPGRIQRRMHRVRAQESYSASGISRRTLCACSGVTRVARTGSCSCSSFRMIPAICSAVFPAP